MSFRVRGAWSAVLGLGCACASAPVPRAALSEQGVVACQTGARTVDARHCPGSALVVEPVPLQEGPVLLRTYRDQLRRQGPEGESECEFSVSPRGTGEHPSLRALNREMHLPDPKTSPWTAWLRERTGLPGLKVQTLVELDLDGDGRRELVFVANGPEDPHLPEHGPLETHALLGVVSGETVSYFINQRLKLGPNDGVEDVERVSLTGFTDLDGDGRLELLVHRDLYEGYRTQVVAFDGVGFRLLGERLCAL